VKRPPLRRRRASTKQAPVTPAPDAAAPSRCDAAQRLTLHRSCGLWLPSAAACCPLVLCPAPLLCPRAILAAHGAGCCAPGVPRRRAVDPRASHRPPPHLQRAPWHAPHRRQRRHGPTRTRLPPEHHPRARTRPAIACISPSPAPRASRRLALHAGHARDDHPPGAVHDALSPHPHRTLCWQGAARLLQGVSMCRTPRDLACAAAAGVARPCAYRCRAAAVLDAQCRRRRSRSTAPHGRAAALCRRRSRAPFSFGADDGSAKARLRHAVHVLCCPASRQRHERAARPDLARCCTAHARVTAPLWSPQQLQLEVFDTAKCDLKRGRGNAAFPMESWHMKRDGPRRRACEATIAVGGVERRICAAGAAPALRERMSLRSATSRRGDPHRHPHPAPSLHIVSPTAAALADAASTAAFVGALSLSLSLPPSFLRSGARSSAAFRQAAPRRQREPALRPCGHRVGRAVPPMRARQLGSESHVRACRPAILQSRLARLYALYHT
jgi:hypothetical protein